MQSAAVLLAILSTPTTMSTSSCLFVGLLVSGGWLGLGVTYTTRSRSQSHNDLSLPSLTYLREHRVARPVPRHHPSPTANPTRPRNGPLPPLLLLCGRMQLSQQAPTPALGRRLVVLHRPRVGQREEAGPGGGGARLAERALVVVAAARALGAGVGGGDGDVAALDLSVDLNQRRQLRAVVALSGCN